MVASGAPIRLDHPMTNRISRRHFLSAAIAATAGAVAWPLKAAAPETSLRPKARNSDLVKRLQSPAEELIAKARLNGQVGFAVADLSDGSLLEEHNPGISMPPASVAKALTAAYALEALGAQHRFATRVLAGGLVSNGVLKGDLILAGGGDPTLDTDALADLAAQVKAAGVTRVTGNLLVWGDALPRIDRIDREQPDHVGYSPAVSGLNVNFNRVHFEWRKAGGAYNVTMQGRSAKHRPDVRFAKMVVAPRSLPIYTYEDKGGRDNWSVARNALGDGGSRWLPVRKPELYAGELLQGFLKSYGITIGGVKLAGRAAPKGAQLARHLSAPLDEVLRDMLKYSNNLTAEVVGLTATAVRRGSRPNSLRDSAGEMNRWAKTRFGLQSLALVDHSGLGAKSRISARDMMLALQGLRRETALKPLLKKFSMRDKQRRVIKDHPLQVLAKTGTLNFVSGLAGYVDLPDGRELVFAIFTADLDRRSKLSVAERERPQGGKAWNVRAKTLQQALIERWGVLYGT